MDSSDLIKRFKVAETKRANFKNLYEDCFKYSAPQRDTFDNEVAGEERDGKGFVFDSTPQVALSKFVSNMQSSLVPPHTEWIKLVTGAGVPQEEKKQLQVGLDYATALFFASIKNSNFDVEISRSFYDLGAGVGAVLFNEGTYEQPFDFISVPLSQLYLEGSANGEISAVFRKHKIPVRAIFDTWEDAKISQDILDVAKDKPEKEYEFIESTTKGKITVNKKVIDAMGNEKIVQSKEDGFIYNVICMKDKNIIVQREMTTNPWIVFRWEVMAGECYGRGPLTFALPDIKSLNKVKELILQNASLAVAGAWTVQDDGVINIDNLRIEAGSLIPVSYNEGALNGPTISALPRSGDFNVGDFVINDLRASINDILFAEPLGPIDSPVRTATEVSMRQQALAKRIGSSFGRLQRELIIPIVNRGLDILIRKGILDSDKISVDGQIINAEYQSPIAIAQNNENVIKVQQFIELTAGMLGPQVAIALLNPAVFQYFAEQLGIPANLVKSPEQIEQMIQLLSQQMQQQGGQQVEGV